MRERRDAVAAGVRGPQPAGVELLVILDGASEPAREGAPTSLERAATPALDALCAEGSLTRLRTVAPWLEAGSEHAIPALLGWTPPAPVDRGAVEAAAHGIAVGDGERAWRIDVRVAGSGARADAAAALPSLAAALMSHRLHLLGGHRLLAVGPAPLPALAPLDLAPLDLAPLDCLTLVRWPAGVVPPRLLDARTVVIAAPGAAAGLARLLGARVVTPAGATGRPGSDLAAKAAAALAALGDRDERAGGDRHDATVDGSDGGEARASADRVERIVVHVGAPDEAAHELDAAAKIAAIEAADRDVIAPLAAALRTRGAGTLRVCPDHGCDPSDGRHDAAPVPCVTWSAQAEPASARAAPRSAQAEPASAHAAPRSAQAAPRLIERAVVALPVTLPVELATSGRAAA